MPRNYKRKRPGPAYTQEDMERAVSDVENKNKTFREADEFYGIPKAVIYHRIKGRKVNINKMGAGRPPTLSAEVETELENCIKAKARMGCPSDKSDIKEIVAEYVRTHQLQTPFKDGIPGEDWFHEKIGFMRRHPRLSFKKPEHLQKSRKDARKPNIVYNFYEELGEVIKNYEVTFPEKSCFIFNCNETGFCSDPRRLKAVGEKGVPLSRVSGGSGRESTSVLATVSADGQCLPPLIIFKGVAVQARWTSSEAYPGTLYKTSSNGWMEEPVFHEWITKSFISHVLQLRVAKNMPDQAAILIYDGHKTHISYRIIKAAMDNNIQLVKLPAHLSDKLQPLDKTVFKPVKDDWEKKLISFAKKQLEERESGRLSKCKFVEMLGAVWKSSMKPQNIVNGFSSTGIFPCDPTKFPESLFDPVELNTYKNKKLKGAAAVGSSDEGPSVSKLLNTVNNKEMPSTSNLNLSTTTRIDDYEETMGPKSHELTLNDERVGSTSCSRNQFAEVSENGLSRSTPSPQTIINIFSSKLSSKSFLSDPIMTKRKETIPRLKPLKYGEILTTEEVLLKQKQAEELKTNKNTGKPKNRDKKKNKKTDKKAADEDDRLSDVVLCQDESDGDVEDWAENIRMETVPEVQYKTPIWKNIVPGSFLLVDFLGGPRKKTHYKYVCRVENVDDDDGEVLIQGYKRASNLSTKFSFIPKDVSTTTIDSIIAILPDPESLVDNGEIFVVFPGQVSVQEKS